MSDIKDISMNSSEDKVNILDDFDKKELNIDGEKINKEFKSKKEFGMPKESSKFGIKKEGGFRNNMKKKSFFAKKVCKFSTNQIDPNTINYKNIDLLKRFIMPSGKILPRRITGTSSKYQRVLACEIKKARIMAFLPFSAR